MEKHPHSHKQIWFGGVRIIDVPYDDDNVVVVVVVVVVVIIVVWGYIIIIASAL